MITSGTCPARIATPNRYTLAMKPAVGGMPASENMKTAIAKPSHGRRNPRPARSPSSTRSSCSRPSSVSTPNAPRFITE